MKELFAFIGGIADILAASAEVAGSYVKPIIRQIQWMTRGVLALFGILLLVAMFCPPSIVHAVAPGFIGTDMVRAMPQKVVETMEQKTPLARLGEPDDIANAYVWLASDAAKFIHGAVLSVDGGLVLGT